MSILVFLNVHHYFQQKTTNCRRHQDHCQKNRKENEPGTQHVKVDFFTCRLLQAYTGCEIHQSWELKEAAAG